MIANFRWLTGLMLVLGLFLTGCSDSSEQQNQTSTTGTDAETEEQETVTWRFALEEVQGSVQDAYAQEFKKRIEEKSEGAVSVEVYPYGALGTSSQLTELVQNGALELAFASPGHLASVIPEVGIFTLHFVLSDNNDINKEILSSDRVHEILQPAYHEQNMHLLSIIPEGWMVWTANKPLRTPADFEDFKMRTMTSPILTAAYEAYDANPTPKPYSEVYSALQLGEIDGQVNPIFAVEEMSFYEEQDYLIQAKHEQFIATFLAGNDWFQALPEERKQLITEVRDELVDWIYQEQEEYNEERLQIIKDAGGTEVITLTEEERQAFREASMPVRDLYLEAAGERGQKLLDYITTQVEQKTDSSSAADSSGESSSEESSPEEDSPVESAATAE